MMEDKLNVYQRIRLEALNQAVHRNAMRTGPVVVDQILAEAQQYERYIHTGGPEEDAK